MLATSCSIWLAIMLAACVHWNMGLQVLGKCSVFLERPKMPNRHFKSEGHTKYINPTIQKDKQQRAQTPMHQCQGGLKDKILSTETALDPGAHFLILRACVFHFLCCVLGWGCLTMRGSGKRSVEQGHDSTWIAKGPHPWTCGRPQRRSTRRSTSNCALEHQCLVSKCTY